MSRKVRSRIGRWLFEPSLHIIDVVERRRARLVSKLQLAHAAQLLISTIEIGQDDSGAPLVVRKVMPIVLGVACCLVLICFALSRSRYARVSVWSYISIALAICPVALLVTRPTDAVLPLMCIAFLLPPVLLANAIASARAAWWTGVFGFIPMLLVIKLVGAPSWAEGIRPGIIFYVTLVILIVTFGVHRDNVQSDRAAELRSRNRELEALRLTLDEKVKERTLELSARNADMRLVLDNVSQGIFTVAQSGAMSSEHSAMLSKWFGPFVRPPKKISGRAYSSRECRRQPKSPISRAAALVWGRSALRFRPSAANCRCGANRAREHG